MSRYFIIWFRTCLNWGIVSWNNFPHTTEFRKREVLEDQLWSHWHYVWREVMWMIKIQRYELSGEETWKPKLTLSVVFLQFSFSWGRSLSLIIRPKWTVRSCSICMTALASRRWLPSWTVSLLLFCWTLPTEKSSWEEIRMAFGLCSNSSQTMDSSQSALKPKVMGWFITPPRIRLFYTLMRNYLPIFSIA